MFDLVIANPPFGNQGTLAKDILTSLHSKAREIVTISPGQGLANVWQYADTIVKNDQHTFTGMNIQTFTVHLQSYETKKFTNLDDMRIQAFPEKYEWQKAVEEYNKTHKSHMEYLGAVKSKANRARFEGKDCSLIFTIAQYSPAPHHRITSPTILKGEDARINLLKEPINFDKPNCLYAVLFDDSTQWEGFSRVWYGFNCRPAGWTSIADQKGSLIDFILDCVYTVGGDGPSLQRYIPFIPNLDWSHPWTDEEIIEELKEKAGLPGSWTLFSPLTKKKEKKRCATTVNLE